MPISIPQLINQLRSATGQDSVNLPDTDNGSTIGALTFLNRSFWEIANKFNFRVLEVTSTDVTVANQAIYTPPALLEAINGIAILDPNTDTYTRLDPMDINIYRNKQTTDTSQNALPINYIRYGSNYYLYPTPDAVYTLEIDYQQTIVDLVSGNPPIPREWHEIILYGAAWRVFSDVNGDLARATWYKNNQAGLINTTVPVQSKEEMDYSNAGVNVRGRTY